MKPSPRHAAAAGQRLLHQLVDGQAGRHHHGRGVGEYQAAAAAEHVARKGPRVLLHEALAVDQAQRPVVGHHGQGFEQGLLAEQPVHVLVAGVGESAPWAG